MTYQEKLESYKLSILKTIESRVKGSVSVNTDPEHDFLEVKVSFRGIHVKRTFTGMSKCMRRYTPDYLAAVVINDFHEAVLNMFYIGDGWNVTDLLSKIGA